MKRDEAVSPLLKLLAACEAYVSEEFMVKQLVVKIDRITIDEMKRKLLEEPKPGPDLVLK